MKKSFNDYVNEVQFKKYMHINYHGYEINRNLLESFSRLQIDAMLGGHEMPPNYIGKTRIPEDHIRTYHKMVNIPLSEIIRVPDQNFDVNEIKNKIENSHILPYKIDGYQLYSTVVGIRTIISLVDEEVNDIAAFAIFIQRPDRMENLWQAKHVQTEKNYKGKKLVGKIYKFCIEHLNWTIQSDFEQIEAGKILWTKILPSLGLIPKILDMKTQWVYPNDGGIDVYNGNKRYCWVLNFYGTYSNDVDKELRESIEKGSSLIKPYDSYVTKKNYI